MSTHESRYKHPLSRLTFTSRELIFTDASFEAERIGYAAAPPFGAVESTTPVPTMP